MKCNFIFINKRKGSFFVLRTFEIVSNSSFEFLRKEIAIKSAKSKFLVISRKEVFYNGDIMYLGTLRASI